MKTLQGAVTGLLIFTAVGLNFTSHAQTDTTVAAEIATDPLDSIQPVPEGEIVLSGTWYRLSDIVNIPGKSLFAAPPFPMRPPNTENDPAFVLDAGMQIFLVDDTRENGLPLNQTQVAAEIVRARILNLVQMVQSTAADRELSLSSATMMSAETLDGEMMTMESSESSSFAEMYSSEELWLEMISKTNTWGNFVIHPPTTELETGVYDLFMTTNLSADVPGLNATNWTWLLRTSAGQTNVAYSPLTDQISFFRLGRTNDTDGDLMSDALELLSAHTDPSNGDQNTNGLPDGWEWMHFGNLDQPYNGDYDGDGNLNWSEYNTFSDPNDISFAYSLTNFYVNARSGILPLNVVTGVPSSIALMIDGTNFSSATWEHCTGPRVAYNVASDGWHNVWTGMRGRLTTSDQTWKWIRIKVDTVPPLLILTNPIVSTVAQPMIQVQGYCPEPLESISFDLTNAAGIFTNQPVVVISQHYDTNTWDFTTNYFQAFDVPLTNGINTLTFKATDLAGNVTVTNFSFLLDYSLKTNPPVVQLSWPNEGDSVSGSSFTWRGWIDDFTATVSAQYVSTNGTTNVVSGIVERDGTFWVENIPLPSGTNDFQLDVFDKAGNHFATNINVVKSSALLAITGNYPVEPEREFTTVHGTVSSNYTVWVNGVKADVGPTGSWTALNVPVTSGGVAVFQAIAIPNSDNNGDGSGGGNNGGNPSSPPSNPSSPGAPQVQYSADKPSKVYQESYEYDYVGYNPLLAAWQRYEEFYSDGTIRDWMETTSDQRIHFSWQVAGGGKRTWNDVTHYLAESGSGENTCDSMALWAKPSAAQYYNWFWVEGTNSMTCNEYGSTNETGGMIGGAPIMGQSCNIQQQSTTVNQSFLGSYYSKLTTRCQFSRSMQATMKLFIGGKAIPGSTATYALSASALENLWKGAADDQIHSSGSYWGTYRGLRGIPSQQVTLGGFGALDSDGKVYAALSPGTTVDITPKVKGVDYYEFSSGAVKCQPRIYFNGTNVTGLIVPVVVGQKIALTCVLDGTNSSFLPANGSCNWTVPGYAISNYIATVNSGVVYSNFPTANSNVVFYWVDGGMQTVSVEAGRSGSKATVDFTVYKPSVTFTDIPPSFATNAIDPLDGTGYLQLGFEAGTGNMQFQGDVRSQFSGRTDLRQFINRSAANGNTTSSTGGEYWLDNVLFYTTKQNDPDFAHQVFTNKVRQMVLGDAPSFQLAHSLFGNITSVFDQFKTYVLFRPDNGNSANNIYVPIAQITWAWSAATTYSSGSWSTPTYSITRPHFSTNISQIPEWPNVYGNH